MPTVIGAIRDKWLALGGATSFLGQPLTDETITPDGIGRFNRFQGGSIYWSPTTGAYEVHGAIKGKWASLGYERSFLKYPRTDETKTPDGIGRFNHFQGGSIYWSPATGAHEVHGAIKDKWASLGYERSFLGYPLTDESITPDGIGRYNHFQGGSIYWSHTTGAHEVHGAIRDKWASLGYERSSLGYPTSDEQDFSEGGRVSTFQHQAIYWWPDTGPITLGNIVVRYKGLFCFGETDEASASDEPYAILGVIPTITNQTTTMRTQIYEGVDGGDSREDAIELYRGLPYGLQLTTVLMEHDLADPDKYKETIKVAVDKAAEGVALGLDHIPIVGPILAPIGEVLLRAISPDVVEALNDLVGGKDDHIGTAKLIVSPKDMVRLTLVDKQNLNGIEWHLDSPLISDGEASYKVYVDVTAE